ncbi:MAG: hypothetical protein AAGD25_20400 [Cyanobacteria bacterium P01_F01_bin.150]
MTMNADPITAAQQAIAQAELAAQQAVAQANAAANTDISDAIAAAQDAVAQAIATTNLGNAIAAAQKAVAQAQVAATSDIGNAEAAASQGEAEAEAVYLLTQQALQNDQIAVVQALLILEMQGIKAGMAAYKKSIAEATSTFQSVSAKAQSAAQQVQSAYNVDVGQDSLTASAATLYAQASVSVNATFKASEARLQAR